MLKAKQKTVSILLACLTMLAALVFGLVSFFNTPTTTASAATAYVETTFGEGKLLITTTFDGSTYYLPATTTSSAPVATLFTEVSEISEDHLWTVTANGNYYHIKNSEDKYLYTTSDNNGVRVGTTTTERTWKYDATANSFQYVPTSRYLGIYNAANWRCYTTVNQSNYKESSTSFKFYKVNEGGSEEPKEIFDLTYSYPTSVTFNGAESTVSVEEGTKITLPDTTAPAGYVFAGWADEAINTPTTTKPTLYTDTYTVTAEKTLYAVYHNDVEAGSWNLVTDISTLATDDIVTIAAPASNVAIGAPSGDIFTYVSANFVEGVLQDSDNLSKLTLTKNSDETYSFYTGSVYLALTSNANKLHNSTSITKNSSWNITIDNDSVADIQSAAYTRYIRYNSGSPRFACYTSGQVDVKLYEYTAGAEISYTSVFCDHSETYTETEEATCTRDGAIIKKCSNCDAEISRETIEATGHQNTTTTTVDATCTENGSITVTCDDCGETVSTEIIAATGHSLDEGVTTTEPQVGVEGEITYTCQNGCGYTVTESIPALDATKYTITYSVPNGVEAPENEERASGETLILPSVSSPVGFTFIGWVDTPCQESIDIPSFYEEGSEYEIEEAITFYALYSYQKGAPESWNLVTSTSQLAVGSEIIIAASNANNAMGADKGNNRNVAAINKSNNQITWATDAPIQIITLEAGKLENTYAFNVGTAGYLYAASSSSNYLKTKTTLDENGSWIISVTSEGVATVTAQGSYTRNLMKYNPNNNSPLFACYASNSTTGSLVSLYVKEGGLFSCYTTDVNVNIDSASITVGDSLTVNYKVSMPAAYADAVMHFTLDGKTEEVSGTLVGTQYVFSLPVPPQAMADNIEAKLYFNDVLLASKATYSIQEYAQNKLNDAGSSAELKRLVSDMLYYGAAAQIYKNHNTGNLATADVANLLAATDEAPAEISKSTNVYNTEITEYPAYIASAGVYFDGVNQLYIKLNTIENVKVYVTIGDGERCEANLTGTTYYTDGISATGFATEYVFEVYHNDTLMQTLTYSVDAYVYAKKGHAEIGELALALYRYGKSAEAYKNA